MMENTRDWQDCGATGINHFGKCFTVSTRSEYMPDDAMIPLLGISPAKATGTNRACKGDNNRIKGSECAENRFLMQTQP